MKIKAFVLRRKMSKQGKTYYVAPYGNVDLLGFEVGESGDIEVSYVERTEKPATAGFRASQVQATSRPKITPRANPVQIREPARTAPHHRPEPQDFVDHTQNSSPWDAPMPTEDDIPF